MICDERVSVFLKNAPIFFQPWWLEAMNIAGQTKVDEVSAVIKYARLLVCNDSGQNAHWQCPRHAIGRALWPHR